MMKKFGKIFVFVLAAVAAFCCTACGKGDRDQGDASHKEYVWVPKFLTLDAENADFYRSQIKDGILYAISYQWDETTGTSTVNLKGFSLADGTQQISLPLEQSGESGQDRYIEQFALDSQGNILTYESSYQWDEASGEGTRHCYLCRYDMSGKRTMDVDFSDQAGEDSYVQSMALDAKDRVYFSLNSAILLLDADGSFRGKIDAGSDSYIGAMGMNREQVMCVVINNYGAVESGTQLREIDFDGKALGASYANCPRGIYNDLIMPGIEKSLMFSDGNTMYEYDTNTQTPEELFKWLDSDINGSQVTYMAKLDDERIAVISTDWTNSETEVALLTRTRYADAPQKTVITIGGLYTDSGVESAAVKFNKSNPKYRISIKNYYDYNQVKQDNFEEVMNDALTRLNNDITSRNCPDLLDLAQLNLVKLAAVGALEDLDPYLEKSSVLNKEDYLDTVIDCFTRDGKLLAIPRFFELTTVAGKTSEVGDKPGWTLEDVIAYADAHPKAVIFDYAGKADILQYLVSYNQGMFVDWKTGECSFETDTFKDLLRFADRFPDEYDWNSSDGRSTPTKIAAGDVLLEREYLYNFQSIQEAEGKFGEPVTFIGYPNNEGTGGCYIQTNSGLLALASKSKNKDGAWEFLESYLAAEKTWSDFGLPSRKADLQAARDKATQPEYAKDENGENILNENGEAIEIGGGGSIGYEDGWTYEYHLTTQEEADRLMELIEIARPALDSDTQILNIITEEAQPFFKGDKSADDVASIIQSRVRLYVSENR